MLRAMTEMLPSGAVPLSLPFTGRWLVQNSPALRVPSHGTDLLGERYAIDFVPVDERGRSADRRDWRTALATEPPERFSGFGRPILAPADGVVVAAHDGEVDHEARRSPLALVPYLLGQRDRLRQGVNAIAGNHLVLRLGGGRRGGGPFLGLVHLRAGSLRVEVGDAVRTGQQLAECGNSGNSTQPHLHLQVMDSADLSVARGLPFAFLGYREWRRGHGTADLREPGVPAEAAIVEPLG
jgi:hypothetical protein